MPEATFARAIRRVVRKRLRALLHDAGRALERGRASELHALRVDVKRLRYNLEFIVPLARDDTLMALELLALLQERLGTLADADAFARTYRSLQKQLDSADERHAGVEALRACAARDRERALAAVRGLWLGEGASYPERLAASISSALGSLSPKDDA